MSESRGCLADEFARRRGCKRVLRFTDDDSFHFCSSVEHVSLNLLL